MQPRGSSILLLGGSGLVGTAVARRLLTHGPSRLVISGLTREESEGAVEELLPHAGGTKIEAVWGDIFVPAELAGKPRREILADPAARRRLVADLLSPTSTSSSENLLYQWLTKFRPDAVVDSINTATAFAYRDVFTSSRELHAAASAGSVDLEDVERHLLTLYIPQLIRHVQILMDGLKKAGTQAYVKIGTAGTGGMGFNIPYTHSEETPSPTLMAKSAVAGAQSLFLFLMGRTPGAPAIIEVKPTAAIGWREIGYGPIRRGGRPIPLVDCVEPLAMNDAFSDGARGWKATGGSLENVFINLGENGLFARDEFETLSALGQMEVVTSEEIAEVVVQELTGRPTGRNIVAALDSATLGPTYRGGYLRAMAMQGLDALEQEHGVRSVAFEMLGPPRLSKLLYEAHLLSLTCPTVNALAKSRGEDLARATQKIVREQSPDLRRQMLSVGVPIVLPDGRVLRGETVVVAPTANQPDMAARGWVDLRPANLARWVTRAQTIVAEPPMEGSGSSANWEGMRPDGPIVPPRMAVWIFEREEGGYRIKR